MHAPVPPFEESTNYRPDADLLNRLSALRDGLKAESSSTGNELSRLLHDAHQALLEKNLHISALVDKSSAIAFELSPDGTILDLNDNLLSELDFTREELLGRKWREICVNEDGIEHLEGIIRFLRDNKADHKLFLKRKDNRIKEYSACTTIRHGLNGEAERVIGHGIAAARVAEPWSGIWRQIINLIPIPIVIIDPETHLILDCNSTAAKLIGASVEETIGRGCQGFMCKARKGWCPVTDMSMKINNTECTLLASKGQQIPVRKNVTPITINGRTVILEAFVDISEYKAADDALKASERKLKEIFRNSNDGIALHEITEDGKLGRLIDINDVGCHMLSGEREEILQTDPIEFVAPECRHLVSELVSSLLQNGSLQCEITLQDTHGNPIPVELSTNLYENNGLREVLLIAHDISERKQAQMKISMHAAHAEALVKISSELNSELDMSVILPKVCDCAVDALGASLSSVMLYDEESDLLTHAVFGGNAPSGYFAKAQPVHPKMFGSSVYNPESVFVIPDLQLLESSPNLDLYKEHKFTTIVGAGMLRHGQLIGVLLLGMLGQSREFTDDELSLFRGLANQAAQAISNAQLFQDSTRRLSFLQALRDVDKAISASMDLEVILQVLLNQVIVQLGAHAADVLLFDQHSHLLEYASGTGFKTKALQNTCLRLGHGFAGRAAQTRKLFRVPNLCDEQNEMTASPLFKSEGFTTYYAISLYAKGQLQGVLEVFFRKSFDPDPEWMEFLEALAGQAAIAIDNASLFDAQQSANTELMLAYDSTLEGWSRALDLRDKETEGHSIRVTEMTVRLAKAMGISKQELVHIRRGALLHDIGKVGIPDSILLKPGKLTEEEWSVMHHHPTSAYELLAKIPFLRPALDIPYYHHERWDGSGYPLGLKEDQIPLAARIFSVVDVWDALCSDRPYRAAWDKQKAKEYISNAAGNQFDPHVVRVFLKIADTL